MHQIYRILDTIPRTRQIRDSFENKIGTLVKGTRRASLARGSKHALPPFSHCCYYLQCLPTVVALPLLGRFH